MEVIGRLKNPQKVAHTRDRWISPSAQRDLDEPKKESKVKIKVPKKRILVVLTCEVWQTSVQEKEKVAGFLIFLDNS